MRVVLYQIRATKDQRRLSIMAPNTGTLIVDKACVTSTSGGTCPGNPSFNVQVTGNNAQPTSFSISNGGSQSIILGGGSFTVSEDSTPGFTTSFSGDCMQTSSSGSQEATGTIAAGQHLTCTITNTAVPTTGTLDIIKVCSDFSNGSLCRLNEFDIIVTGNNAQPSSFSLTDGGSRSVTLGPGSFTITELPVPGFLPASFSGDCTLVSSSSGKVVATGTISEGQHLTCTITNSAL